MACDERTNTMAANEAAYLDVRNFDHTDRAEAARSIVKMVMESRQDPGSVCLRIDTADVNYRVVNKVVREAVAAGVKRFELHGINGQRYIGDGLKGDITIDIYGVPGNDVAAFMNGPRIVVHNNAQDGLANTMNDGKILVHGDAGDVLGYGMRGGKLYVLGSVGYRVGIHMKSYKAQVPVIIAGGVAGDFYGEYMAGGIQILLGRDMENGQSIVGDYVGTGMHGGVIYVRGEVPPHRLGKEVGVKPLIREDEELLTSYLGEYAEDFGLDLEELISGQFIKLVPVSLRPYGKLYTY